LRQISREIYGQSFYHRAGMEASTLSIVEPRAREEIYKNARNLIMEGAAMTAFYSRAMLERLKHKDKIELTQGAAALKILEKSNLFDIMSGVLKEEPKNK